MMLAFYARLASTRSWKSLCGIYGDPAYPILRLLVRLYADATLTQQQVFFNGGMSTVRQAVEWGFGKMVSEFAFLDFKMNHKLYLQDVWKMYWGAILSNCHTRLYGSQDWHALRAPCTQIEAILETLCTGWKQLLKFPWYSAQQTYMEHSNSVLSY
ncbi:uncharacterized protein LOC115325846 [Ixodes scapularis]|uniref:uncharacterized protein LOC115325846 n=1 Tax=Ixodes scapularis TaxID=6945 RepID=UPI001A9EEF7D|nr:uncharacterized protein LOC115325846 [Ixodes scapularis]